MGKRVAVPIVCRHCERAASRDSGRGLCSVCFRDAGVRSLYERKRFVEPEPLVLPTGDDDEPCPHPPGSPEKVEWLRRRYLGGRRLWREGDAGHDNGEDA